MWRIHLLPELPSLLWPGVVAPDRVLSKGQIDQNVCKQMNDIKLWLLYSNTWNYLTVCKKRAQAHGSSQVVNFNQSQRQMACFKWISPRTEPKKPHTWSLHKYVCVCVCVCVCARARLSVKIVYISN